MRASRLLAIFLCLLLLFGLMPANAEGVISTEEELRSLLLEHQKAYTFNIEMQLSSELYEALSPGRFARLNRICYQSGMTAFRLRYNTTGAIEFQNITWQPSVAAAECSTYEETRAALEGFLAENKGNITLILNDEMFTKLYSERGLMSMLAQLGVENVKLSASFSEHVCFLSGIRKMAVPYAYVKSVEEAGDAAAAWYAAGEKAFNLIFDEEVYSKLGYDDYRLIAFLGGMENYDLGRDYNTYSLKFTNIVHTTLPGVYCTSDEEIVAAIRAMGAQGITAFQLKLEENLYRTATANAFKHLYELEAQAGTTASDLRYSGSLCIVQFENAIIQSDITPLKTMAEVVAHVEACAQRGDSDISMLLDPAVYADLMEGVTSFQIGKSNAKFYDLLLNAGIGGVSSYYRNPAAGTINLSGIQYFAGARILQAMANGTTASLSEREQQALAAAQQLAAACQRDNAAATALALHDALCASVVYLEDPNTDEDDCCIGALLNGVANCDGYADAFLLAGRLAGLNVRYQHGDSTRSGLSNFFSTHIWNLVEIDGSWRMVDVTWDDGLDTTYHLWFNVGQDRAAKMHKWHADMSVPLLAETDSNRPVVEYFAATLDEVTAAAAKAESEGHTTFVILFPASSDLTQFTLPDAVSKGVSKAFRYTILLDMGSMHIVLN